MSGSIIASLREHCELSAAENISCVSGKQRRAVCVCREAVCLGLVCVGCVCVGRLCVQALSV